MFVLLVSLFFVTWKLQAHRTFFFDEWDMVLTRRSQGIEPLLRSHNGHLYLTTVGAYRLLFHFVGLSHYRPYSLLAFVGHGLVVIATFVAIRARRQALTAICGATTIAYLGSGWGNWIWPFQFGVMSATAFGLLAVATLDRDSRRRRVMSCVCLSIALASSGGGIAAAAGVAGRLVYERRWRALWIVGGPMSVYGLWYLRYGGSPRQGGALSAAPGFLAREFAAAIAGLAGRPLVWGMLAGGALLGYGFRALPRTRRELLLLDGGAIGIAMTLAAFWGLTALTRSAVAGPDTSRYVYVGSCLALVAVLRVLPDRQSWTGRLSILAAAGLCVWGGVAQVRRAADDLQRTASIVSSELGALELSEGPIPSDYRPDMLRAPQIAAGPYRAAVRDLDSPAFTESVIAEQSETVRFESDRVLIEILLSHQDRLSDLGTGPGQNDAIVSTSPCLSNDSVINSKGRITVANSTTSVVPILARRFADRFNPTPIASLPPNTRVTIILGTGGGTLPWVVASADPARFLCAAQ
jgi:hypothetical protein